MIDILSISCLACDQPFKLFLKQIENVVNKYIVGSIAFL